MTIFDAYQCHYRHPIGHEKFDEYFQNIEGVEVVKQTQPQCTSQTRVLNNNRFVIVTHESADKSKIDLGSSVQIMGIKHCFLCGSKHLKRLRKGKTEKRKYYSDSNMQHVSACSHNRRRVYVGRGSGPNL